MSFVSPRFLLPVLASLAVFGCAAPEAADESTTDAMLVSESPSAAWYLGDFSGNCAREGVIERFDLEIFVRDGVLVARRPPPSAGGGAVLAIDTTIFHAQIAPDGTFHHETVNDFYRTELRGRCDAQRCTVTWTERDEEQTTVTATWMLTRTEAGLDWQESERWEDDTSSTTSCSLRRTK